MKNFVPRGQALMTFSGALMSKWSIFMAFYLLLYFKQFPGTVFTLNIFYWMLKESFGVGGTRDKVF